MNETIPYLPGLPPVGGKELCARLDGGRLSETGDDLMSQPSLSRLANAPSWREPALFNARLSDTVSWLIRRTRLRVHIALGVTDMRKGLDGLAMLVQEVLLVATNGLAPFGNSTEFFNGLS